MYIVSKYLPPQIVNYKEKRVSLGTSLVVQGVSLCAPSAGDRGSIPGRGIRSCMHAATKSLHAATKILCAATKTQCSQK